MNPAQRCQPGVAQPGLASTINKPGGGPPTLRRTPVVPKPRENKPAFPAGPRVETPLLLRLASVLPAAQPRLARLSPERNPAPPPRSPLPAC